MIKLLISVIIISICLTGIKLHYLLDIRLSKITKEESQELGRVFIIYLVLIITIVYILHLLDFNIQ